MQTAIVVLEKVSKKYTLYREKPTLVESLLSRSGNETFWALKNISLKIFSGESVGIIGSNGSGKTTLMEIISGITYPSSGIVEISKKVASLIELDAGFHPELTGRQNIVLNGMLVGMSKKEVDEKMSKIVKFAEIGKFIDSPFYTYSQGMKLRLGFSIVVHTDADIYLLDENVSVGDEKFRKKCLQKIDEFRKSGKTMIFVSHDLGFLKSICSKIVWLSEGKLVKEGKVSVLEKYSKRKVKADKYD